MEDFLDLTVNASADSVVALVAVAALKAVAVEDCDRDDRCGRRFRFRRGCDRDWD